MRKLNLDLQADRAYEARRHAYKLYHQRVVEECVKLAGEEYRQFFERECTYYDEFAQGIDPTQVAQDQLEALT